MMHSFSIFLHFQRREENRKQLHNTNSTNNKNIGTVDGLLFYRPFGRRKKFPSFGWYFQHIYTDNDINIHVKSVPFSLHDSPFAYFVKMKTQNLRYPLTVM